MVQVGIRVPSKHLFTVEEYHRMAATGILGPEERVELIEGEIIDMLPIGAPHAGVVGNLTTLFARLADKCQLWIQNPIRLSQLSEPQPDVALLVPRPGVYVRDHPMPQDVLLVVEVADTSLQQDRGIKVPLYARHRIREVWIVNVPDGTLERYLGPEGDAYTIHHVFQRGQRLSPAAFPDLEIAVDSVLG